MSKQANPANIGAFVVGAAVVAFGLLAYFGSAKLFGGAKVTFVCFFEETVDGLQIGSKVKLKGVPIGEVKKILIRFNTPVGKDGRRKPSIPVIIELDRERLSKDLGVDIDLAKEERYLQQIGQGLSATLAMGNLLTGILNINLDYDESTAKEAAKSGFRRFSYQGEKYPVIPTRPSKSERVTQDLLSIAANIGETDFKGLVDGLKDILEKIGGKFDQFEVKGINAALASIQKRMESEELDEALASFTDALTEIKTVAKKLDDQLGDDDEIKNAIVAANQSMKSIDETFASLQETVLALNEIVKENREVPQELQRSIRQIGDAAAQVELFVAQLREKPNSLIFGRGKDTDESDGTGDRDRRKPWEGGPRAR